MTYNVMLVDGPSDGVRLTLKELSSYIVIPLWSRGGTGIGDYTYQRAETIDDLTIYRPLSKPQ